MSGPVFVNGQWRRAEETAADRRARNVGRVIGAVAALFIGAWLVMLAMGSLHHDIPAVPTVGYWTCVLVLAGADAAAGVIRRIDFEK